MLKGRDLNQRFHIVFDVETKSSDHLEIREEELAVYADDLPDIDSFTIYRSLTAPASVPFGVSKLPKNLEEHVNGEDL